MSLGTLQLYQNEPYFATYWVHNLLAKLSAKEKNFRECQESNPGLPGE